MGRSNALAHAAVLGWDGELPTRQVIQALEAAGPIDAVVNNAGVGVVGAFEATPMTTIRSDMLRFPAGADAVELARASAGARTL